MKENRTVRATMVAIVILCLLGSIDRACGYDIDIECGKPLEGGGFLGSPPSYLVVLKVSVLPLGDSWIGSGSFLSDRLILTCAHNVRGVKPTDKVTVQTTSGICYTDVEVTSVNETYDLALLYIRDPLVFYHSVLRVSDDEYTPKDVGGMGFMPRKNALVLLQGLPTGRRFGSKDVDGPVFREVSFRVEQGMSGGPMIDSSMDLVGVNVACGQETGPNKADTMSVTIKRIHEFLNAYDGPIGNLEPKRFSFR